MPVDYSSSAIQAYMSGLQSRQSQEDRTKRDKQQDIANKQYEQRVKQAQTEFAEEQKFKAEEFAWRQKKDKRDLANTTRALIAGGALRIPQSEMVENRGIEGPFDQPGQHAIPGGQPWDYQIEGSDIVLPGESIQTRQMMRDSQIQDLQQSAVLEAYKAGLVESAKEQALSPGVEREAQIDADLQEQKDIASAAENEANIVSREAIAAERNINQLKAAEIRAKATENRLAIAEERANRGIIDPSVYLSDIKDGIIVQENLQKMIANPKTRDMATQLARENGFKVFANQDIGDMKAIAKMNTVIDGYAEVMDIYDKEYVSNPVKAEIRIAAKMEKLEPFLAHISQVRTNQPASRLSDMDLTLMKGGGPSRKGAITGENVTKLQIMKDEVNAAIKQMFVGANEEQQKAAFGRFGFKDYNITEAANIGSVIKTTRDATGKLVRVQ